MLATTFGGRVTFAIAGTGLLLVLLAVARALSSPRMAPAFALVTASR